ncbi:unnamed protein product [Lupinus luteus]|uniref:Uncharacterized protein n=1 Tax=Lupinus luteus TaxID=3873 RepID=A0AAV1XID4_LUPLU
MAEILSFITFLKQQSSVLGNSFVPKQLFFFQKYLISKYFTRLDCATFWSDPTRQVSSSKKMEGDKGLNLKTVECLREITGRETGFKGSKRESKINGQQDPDYYCHQILKEVNLNSSSKDDESSTRRALTCQNGQSTYKKFGPAVVNNIHRLYCYR